MLPIARHGVGARVLTLLLCSALGVATADGGPADERPPAGRQRSIAAQRTAIAPEIDGALTEPAWVTPSPADRFWQSARERWPSDQTRVVALYDDVALYVAFICEDARPELMRATQTVSGAAPGLDDHVTVALDPRHDHRSITRFSVTAIGVPSVQVVGGRRRALIASHEWRAATRRTPSGWTAEIAIPLSLLDLRAGAETIGVNFSRYQHRTGELSDWADVTPRRLPEQAGHLTGLRVAAPAAANQLAIRQFVASELATAGGVGTAGLKSLGAPETVVRDRRNFVQEGRAYFGDREVFDSSGIGDFDLGVTTFGRVDAYQVGMLATTDAATGHGNYVGRVARSLGAGLDVSATAAGTRRDAIDNSTLQLQAGGRVGPYLRVEGNIARTSSGDAAGEGTRQRAAIAYQRANWYSGGWADRTDATYFAATGLLAADLAGTIGRGAYGGYTRTLASPWLRRANASVSYDLRDTFGGLRQRESATLYAAADTVANLQLSGAMTVGASRPRGSGAGQWSDTLDDTRYYLASAFYQSPTGQFGYGAQYAWGSAGLQTYDSLAPSLWLAPNPRVSVAYSFERAAYDQVRHQHVLSGTWDITRAQSIAARWVDDRGGYYRLSYRRSLARAIDAFGVYSSDPYDPGRLNLNLVWTLAPLAPR